MTRLASAAVTRILQELGLLDYAATGAPAAVLEAARARGRAIDQALAHIEEHGQAPPDLPLRWQGYAAAYRNFVRDERVQVALRHTRVRGPGYHGELDRVFRAGGRQAPWLVDVKLTAAHPATALQTAAYAIGISGQCDRFGERITTVERFALVLRAEGTYRLVAYTDPADLDRWMEAVSIYHWKRVAGLPMRTGPSRPAAARTGRLRLATMSQRGGMDHGEGN